MLQRPPNGTVAHLPRAPVCRGRSGRSPLGTRRFSAGPNERAAVGCSGLLGCPTRPSHFSRSVFRSSTRKTSIRSGGATGALTRCTPRRVILDAVCYSGAPPTSSAASQRKPCGWRSGRRTSYSTSHFLNLENNRVGGRGAQTHIRKKRTCETRMLTPRAGVCCCSWRAWSAQRPWCKLHGQGPRAEARAARRLPPRSCKATTGELQPP